MASGGAVFEAGVTLGSSRVREPSRWTWRPGPWVVPARGAPGRRHRPPRRRRLGLLWGMFHVGGRAVAAAGDPRRRPRGRLAPLVGREDHPASRSSTAGGGVQAPGRALAEAPESYGRVPVHQHWVVRGVRGQDQGVRWPREVKEGGHGGGEPREWGGTGVEGRQGTPGALPGGERGEARRDRDAGAGGGPDHRGLDRHRCLRHPRGRWGRRHNARGPAGACGRPDADRRRRLRVRGRRRGPETALRHRSAPWTRRPRRGASSGTPGGPSTCVRSSRTPGMAPTGSSCFSP